MRARKNPPEAGKLATNIGRVRASKNPPEAGKLATNIGRMRARKNWRAFGKIKKICSYLTGTYEK
jgi:hypothetical protein